MRTHHLTLTEHQKDMIGHVVISLVLITAFLLAGCDAPVGKKPVAVQQPTTTTPTRGRVPQRWGTSQGSPCSRGKLPPNASLS